MVDRAISVVTTDADGLFRSSLYASTAARFRVEPQEYAGGVRIKLRGNELVSEQLEGGQGCKVVLVGVACQMPEFEPRPDMVVEVAGEVTEPAEEKPDFFDLLEPLPVKLPDAGDFLVQCIWANGQRKVVLLAGDLTCFYTVVHCRLEDVVAVDGNVIYLKNGPDIPVVQGVPQLA